MTEIYQCPYNKVTTCNLMESCKGCVVFAEYLANKNIVECTNCKTMNPIQNISFDKKCKTLVVGNCKHCGHVLWL